MSGRKTGRVPSAGARGSWPVFVRRVGIPRPRTHILRDRDHRDRVDQLGYLDHVNWHPSPVICHHLNLLGLENCVRIILWRCIGHYAVYGSKGQEIITRACYTLHERRRGTRSRPGSTGKKSRRWKPRTPSWRKRPKPARRKRRPARTPGRARCWQTPKSKRICTTCNGLWTSCRRTSSRKPASKCENHTNKIKKHRRVAYNHDKPLHLDN